MFARAGQGAITTAQILGNAIIKSGLHAYAFPHFGAARMGAPMNTFLRYDNKPIRLRTRVKLADCSLVVDGTLFGSQNVVGMTKEDGLIIINSQHKIPNIDGRKVAVVPANSLSIEIAGKIIANTVLLGTLCVFLPDIKFDFLCEAIKERFKGEAAQINLKLLEAGYNYGKQIFKKE
ncbi:MAG: 2-oxoacid:acceptor oxidoreductase family protein [Endomicrobia bacterium]|nr:2-oxoacid:acceptor oxidoreductase family protein [Endomicrobiia bacterium]